MLTKHLHTKYLAPTAHFKITAPKWKPNVNSECHWNCFTLKKSQLVQKLLCVGDSYKTGSRPQMELNREAELPPSPLAMHSFEYCNNAHPHQFCTHCCGVGDPLLRRMQCQRSRLVRLGSQPPPVRSTTWLVLTPRGGAWKSVVVQWHAPPWFRLQEIVISRAFKSLWFIWAYIFHSKSTCPEYRNILNFLCL
jgi:hypothetical protein